jgi:hypothetical protein
MVRKALQHTTGRVRHCANHAFHHLERAGKILTIDPEMAMLRAITAEEEAAVAVFLTLRQRRYPNSEKLQIRSHLYKIGLHPFVMRVYNFLVSTSTEFPPIRLRLAEEESRTNLIWEFRAEDGRWGGPDTPFNFLVSNGETMRPYHFERQMEELAQSLAHGDIKAYIEGLAKHQESSTLC